MNLFAFEFKKLFFSKKFAYLMLFLIIGVGLLFARNIAFQSSVEQDVKQDIITQTRAVQATGRAYTFQLQQNPDNEEIRALQLMNADIRNQLYDLSGVPFTEWQERLVLQNDIYEALILFKEEGGENPLTIQEMTEKIALNEKLLEMQLPPEHASYSIATPNFMMQIVNLLINFGAIILLLLMIGESMSGEFEQHSIHFLFSQPLKKTSIVVSKFWSAIVVYVIMMGTLLLSAFLISFAFGEKGSFQYPLLMERNGEISFLSISEYIGKGIAITSAVALLVISLYLMYSLLFKQTLATLAMILGTLGVGYVVSVFIPWGKLSWLNPFLNLLPNEMIFIENTHIWYEAIPITILIAIVLYFIATRKIHSSFIQ